MSTGRDTPGSTAVYGGVVCGMTDGPVDGMTSGRPPTDRCVVIGVGNPWQGDDGVGAAVASEIRRRAGDRVEVVTLDGEPCRLVEAWDGADVAVVVDALRSGRRPAGTLVVDPGDGVPGSGTHGLGVPEAVALARILHRLPGRLVVVGVEGSRFEAGAGLSDEVAAAVDAAVDTVMTIIDADDSAS